MTFKSYAEALVRNWEKGKATAEDVVRGIREALQEEQEIAEAERREENHGTKGMWL